MARLGVERLSKSNGNVISQGHPVLGIVQKLQSKRRGPEGIREEKKLWAINAVTSPQSELSSNV